MGRIRATRTIRIPCRNHGHDHTFDLDKVVEKYRSCNRSDDQLFRPIEGGIPDARQAARGYLAVRLGTPTGTRIRKVVSCETGVCPPEPATGVWKTKEMSTGRSSSAVESPTAR